MREGNKYQIISQTCHHHFKVGEIVEFIQDYEDGWYELENKRGLKQDVLLRDLKLLKQKKTDSPAS